MARHGRADPYAVLGVVRTASAAQITAAFRKLVRDLHPDAHPDHTEAQERLDRVVAAYSTLRDPQRRAAYDAQHTRTLAGPHLHARQPEDVPNRPWTGYRILTVLGPTTRSPTRQPPLWAGPVRVERPSR
ncbi:J domain-containing protein [Streptomyces sp. NPDC003015]